MVFYYPVAHFKESTSPEEEPLPQYREKLLFYSASHCYLIVIASFLHLFCFNPLLYFYLWFSGFIKFTPQTLFQFHLGVKDLTGFTADQSYSPADFTIVRISQSKLPEFWRTFNKIPAVHIFLLFIFLRSC